MKKLLKKRLVIPILGLIIFFTGTAFQNDFFEIAKQIEIFTTLYKEVNMNYVDDTNPAQLMDTAIKSMLSDLDPYTMMIYAGVALRSKLYSIVCVKYDRHWWLWNP